MTKSYQTTLDDPEATPDPMAREDRLRAALQLAEAEAQLQRCQQTERAHLISKFDYSGSASGCSF